MEKYVAFIDTLGFKNKVGEISHKKAKDTILSFNREIYKLWEKLGYCNDHNIHGRTFSDSFIIHTDNDSNDSLIKILNFLSNLYPIAITKSDLPLRGGLSCGKFDDIPATEFNNLQKGIPIGEAFIEAYSLESSYGIKGSKLIFSNIINNKIKTLSTKFTTQYLLKLNDSKDLYELKWGNIELLIKNNYEFLNKFIELATQSKWLNHYFNTLETFLINESQDKKFEIFSYIIEKLKKEYQYSDLDNFIEHFIKSEGATYVKKSFLAFIREQL